MVVASGGQYMSDNDSIKISAKKLANWLWAIVVILGCIFLYNQRGGTFLVYACKKSTDSCYTVQANLSNKIRHEHATLFFENGGSLSLDCSDSDNGCESSQSDIFTKDIWTIKEIERK